MQHFQCRHSVNTQSMSDVYIYHSLNIYIFIRFFCIMFNTLVLLCNTHLCKPINKWTLDSVSRSPVWQILLFALLPSISLLASIHWKCYCSFSLHPTQTKIITIIHRTEHINSIQILCDIHNPLATNVTEKNIKSYYAPASPHSSHTDSLRSTAPPLVSLRILLKSWSQRRYDRDTPSCMPSWWGWKWAGRGHISPSHLQNRQ